MQRPILIGAVIAAAGVTVAAWDHIEPLVSREQRAREAVRAQLKDPSSAIFRNVRKDGSGYCGEVNAKNSYGGYAGFEAFYAFKPVDGSEWMAILTPDIVKIRCS